MGGEADQSDDHQGLSPLLKIDCAEDGERSEYLETEYSVLDAGEGLLEHLVAGEQHTEDRYHCGHNVGNSGNLLYCDDAEYQRNRHRCPE